MYRGYPSLGFSPFLTYLSKGENPRETEPMYIKHSVSLIGTGGLTYLSKGENPGEAETMYIKHSVSLIGTGGLTYLSKGENPNEEEHMYIKYIDRYARPPVLINATLCLMYIGSASLGFSPFDRYVRPPVPINDTLC
jgi:hypothetical protein